MTLAYVLVVVLVVVTPGQDTALTIRNTLGGGRRAGVWSALGVVTGQATWTIAAAAGLSALLIASAPAFEAVKLVGAAYLVYLGVTTIVRRGRAPHMRRLSAAGAYRQGLLSNLGNPKIAVFFTSLLPQFGSSLLTLLELGAVLCAITLVWLTLYSFAVAKAGDVLRRSRVRRALDAVAGVVLVALGVRVALERA